MAADFDSLARAHMSAQVGEAAKVQLALSVLWDRTIDPDDIGGSFWRFREQAATYIGAGRTLSEATAQRYFGNLKAVAGLDTELPAVVRDVLPAAAAKGSLSAATGKSLKRALDNVRAGDSPNLALATAKGNMLGSAKRQVLNAGRSRLMRLSRADKDIIAWARVTDGGPCSFCAMLVSRGPVYKTANKFPAHDRCGCSVRPVTKNDPSGGWSDDARAYKELWTGDAVTFRHAITERRAALVSDIQRGGAASLPPASGTAGSVARGAQDAPRELVAGLADRRGNLDRLVVGDTELVPLNANLPTPARFKALQDKGAPTARVVELDPATSAGPFREALMRAKASNGSFGSSVTVYDDYADMRLFVTEDGLAGFALNGGDIISVFSHDANPVKGVAHSLLAHAVEQGGNRLDAFDTYLPKIYARNGFRPVARLPFDDEYAPDGWDYDAYAKFNEGRPDVVFFRYDPDRLDSEYNPAEAIPVDDYDAGSALQVD